jgi:hypothetical protein
MVNIFTFCIFGTSPKYCEGLIHNLAQIRDLYPEFETWINVGTDVPAAYIDRYKEFPRVRIFKSSHTGNIIKIHRYFHIDNPVVDLMFPRDADSRFGPRDMWCIARFMESDYKIFTIRDHKNHVVTIMGGQWGMRRIQDFSMRAVYRLYCAGLDDAALDEYFVDQKFLHQYVYKPFRAQMIAYVSDNIIEGDAYQVIELPNRDKWDYCGCVYDAECGSGKQWPVYSLEDG